MKIINEDNPNLTEIAVDTLKKGGIVIYPTETCYGVGVDATNSDAVSKVLKYKKRPSGKPISIGVDSKEMALEYVEINDSANNIYKELLPGPITVISNSKGKVDQRLESEERTLGIRFSSNKTLTKIIKKFGKPITTTSANSSGKKTPYSIEDIFNNISEKQKSLIDLIIDAGELPKNKPSTVIDTTKNELTTYRTGNIDLSKNTKSIKTNSTDETIKTGSEIMSEQLNNLADKAVVFLLYGDLGAGKTHFVKGIATTLGVEKRIKSPTYNYVSEYKLKNKKYLYHLDAWRIKTKEDLDILGIKNWFKPGNVIAIEWPSVLEELNFDFQNDSKTVSIYINTVSINGRKIIVN